MKLTAQKIKILLGPMIGITTMLFFHPDPNNPLIEAGLGTLMWMAIWWMTEAVPLGITGLLPVILFPLTGIMGTKAVTPYYTNQLVFLFIGGFLVAYSMEKWKLHERIALTILKKLGNSPFRILSGFMICSYCLSMWISNTATTVMLVAPAMATIGQMKKLNSNNPNLQKFTILLLLAIAYSATIGGTSTLVGTLPNIIFLGEYEKLGLSTEITFFNWMLFALPTSLALLFAMFFVFKLLIGKTSLVLQQDYFKDELQKIGRITYEEKWVLGLFISLAILWITRKSIVIDEFVIPGWANLFPDREILDSTVAILFSVLLFLIPSKNQPKTSLLSIQEIRKIPLNIILMFGGGFALAAGFIESGLGEYVTSGLSGLKGVPLIIIILCISALVLFTTEFSSNAPTTTLVLPILVLLSYEIDVHPLYLMLPATISASFAFMLPIATPPNAIIFESEQVPVREMMKNGFYLNIIGLIIVTLSVMTLGRYVFDLP